MQVMVGFGERGVRYVDKRLKEDGRCCGCSIQGWKGAVVKAVVSEIAVEERA